jgi:hypothetical protein
MQARVGLLILAVCSCLGCGRINVPHDSSEAPTFEDTIRPATDADRASISAHEATVLRMLRARYGNVELRRTHNDLSLLQRLADDDILRRSKYSELESVGVVFGQILATEAPLKWITVELEGERRLALQYPHTTVIVFPATMIAKRIERGEQLDLRGLFVGVVTQVEKMKNDPQYKR